MQISLENLLEELSGIEAIANPTQVAKLSEDYFHFSPVLVPLLTGKVGDIVVRPKNESEVLRIAKASVKHQIPLTLRGSGTGNYGQSTPLKGGIILETSRLQEIKWIKAGLARVETGVKLAALDKQAQEIGWESRMVPSTYRISTVGGFIAGGSGVLALFCMGNCAIAVT